MFLVVDEVTGKVRYANIQEQLAYQIEFQAIQEEMANKKD